MLFQPLSTLFLSCSLTLESHSIPDLHLKHTVCLRLSLSPPLLLPLSPSPTCLSLPQLYISLYNSAEGAVSDLEVFLSQERLTHCEY